MKSTIIFSIAILFLLTTIPFIGNAQEKMKVKQVAANQESGEISKNAAKKAAKKAEKKTGGKNDGEQK